MVILALSSFFVSSRPCLLCVWGVGVGARSGWLSSNIGLLFFFQGGAEVSKRVLTAPGTEPKKVFSWEGWSGRSILNNLFPDSAWVLFAQLY